MFLRSKIYFVFLLKIFFVPANRNALIRYKTIDKCLQNRYRKWTLEDLINECSEALYEYEGIKKGISKRTIQLDMQIMRSDKLGYNAPIIVYDNKFYTYEDPGYSITNIPLTDKDLGKISEAVEFMKQFKGFSHFRELGGMLQKLEDHVYSHKVNHKPIIDFEKNENLRGLEHLDVLYHSIRQKRAILLTYQSFRARQANTFDFHPYLLKEFRNRWFVVGTKKTNEPLLYLALDRIEDIKPTDTPYHDLKNFDAKLYFKDVIGVTARPNQSPEKVVLFVTHKHAQYVITKPLHHSQKVTGKDHYGVTIELEVQHNFELEKEILGLGDGVLVLQPLRLKRAITERISNTIDLYNTSVNEKEIKIIHKKIIHKGYAVINHLYTKRALNQMGSILHKAGIFDGLGSIGTNLDMEFFPSLKVHLSNRVIEKITKQVSVNVELQKVECYQDIPNELLEWKQSNYGDGLQLIFFLNQRGVSFKSLQLVPGSHRKQLSHNEQHIIIENCVPTDVNLFPGGAILFNPMLLMRLSGKMVNKNRRFFILSFGKASG